MTRLFRVAEAVARRAGRNALMSEGRTSEGRTRRVRPAGRVHLPGIAGADRLTDGSFSPLAVNAPGRVGRHHEVMHPGAAALTIVLPIGLAVLIVPAVPARIAVPSVVARVVRSQGQLLGPPVVSVTPGRPRARPTAVVLVIVRRTGRQIGVVDRMASGGPSRQPRPTAPLHDGTNGLATNEVGTNGAVTGTPPVASHNGRRRRSRVRTSPGRTSSGRPCPVRAGMA